MISHEKWRGGGSSSAVYGLGFIGAVVFYLQHATTFADGLIGIAKSIVWPALFVYKALELLKI